MEFWIDVEDSAGNKLGDGPITTATQWQSTARLDEVGEFAFSMPANDPRAALLQPKRIVRCWAILDDAVTEIGAGIIDQISVTVNDPLELRVSGPDLLQELAERTIPELNICKQELTYLTLDPVSGNWRGAVRELRNTYGETSDNDLPNAHDGDTDSGGDSFRLFREADVHAVYLYVGCDARFDQVHIWLAGRTNDRESTLTGQYYGSNGWADLPNLVDGTKQQNWAGQWCTFKQNGIIRFDRPPDWQRSTPTLAAGSWFWVRFCVASGQRTDDPITLREVAVMADVPTTNGVNQLMAYAPDTWTKSGYAATTTEHYLEVRGESVLAALRALAEQGGQSGGSAVRDHFRLSTSGRKIDWFSAWTTSTVRAQRAGVNTSGNDAVCQILRARKQQDARKLLTRIYPLSRDDITLLDTTRTAPAGYTLNKGLNYISNATAEATYGRVEATVRFSDVSMQQDDTLFWHREMAANALFDRALEHLRTHCQPEEFYALEVVPSSHLFRPGERLHVVYQEYRDGAPTLDINTYPSSPLYILASTVQVRQDGLYTVALEVATTDRSAETDAGTIISGIQDSQRSAGVGALPSVVVRPITTVTAEDGTIAGWRISPSELASNHAVLGSGGYLRLGSGNDRVELNALDGTYRLWAGHTTGASAPFSVSKAGAVKAILGEIAGWTLSASALSKNDTVLSSAGYLQLGTGNAVVRLDALNASYRLWAGNSDAALAPFSVSAAGALKSTSGEIAGWTIGATTLSKANATLSSAGYLLLGTGNDIARLDAADATYRLWIGHANPAEAPFSVMKNGMMKSSYGTIGGWTIGTGSLVSDGGRVVLHRSGYMHIGQDNDILIVDGLDDTHRLWAGHTNKLTAPFAILKDGSIKATAGTIGGWTLTATALSSGTDTDRVVLTVGNPTYRFWAGAVLAAEAPFSVTKEGVVKASSGTIGGWTISTTIQKLTAGVGIILDPATPKIQIGNTGGVHLVLDGAAGTIGTSDYAAGSTGWQATQAGYAEFNNITVRGTLRSTVFQKDVVQAHSGTLIVGKSAGALSVDYTTGGTMYVQTPPGGGWVFETGDVVYIKEEGSLGLSAAWVTVTRTATLNRYNTVLSSGSANTFRKGTAVVNYGKSGQGLLLLTADLANGPYYDVQTHAGAPWTTVTTRVRLGNLAGITDADLSPSGYGLYCDNVFLKGALVAGAGNIILNADGIEILADTAKADRNSYKFSYGGVVTGGLFGFNETHPSNMNAIWLSAEAIAGWDSYLQMGAYAPENETALLDIVCNAADDADSPSINLSSTDGGTSSISFSFNTAGIPYTFTATGAELNAAVVINQGGLDYDTRIEGDTNPNLFFVDASTDRVGVKTNAPDTDLDVHGDVTARRFYLSEDDAAGGAGNVYLCERPGATNRAIMMYVPYQNHLSKFILSAPETDIHHDTGFTIWSRNRDGAGTPDIYYADVMVLGETDGGNVWLRANKTAGIASYPDIVFGFGAMEKLRLKPDGRLIYPGNLTAYRNATEYTGYIYVPLPTPLASTSFDGDAFSDTAATKIDTSAVFGAPAGIKAAMVRLIARDSGAYPQADLHVTLTIDGNLSTAQLSTRPIGGDILVETCGIVNCDSNGDFYYQLNASGVGTLDLWIQIIGYFI